MTNKFRTTLADIITMVTFSFATGMAIEILISGMTLEQSLTSRCSAIFLNLIIARPYGIFRDWILKCFNAPDGFKKRLLDLTAFILFQIPVYIIVLLFSGANAEQIIKAVISVLGFFTFLGFLYSDYLEFVRRRMGV